MTVLKLAMLSLAGSLLVLAADPVNHVEGPGFQIKATRVMRFADSHDRPLYFVEYQYTFAGRETVYIQDLGTAPGSGDFSYFTYEKGLAIRPSINGPILASVRLEETIMTQSQIPILRAPESEEFSKTEGAFTERWKSREPISIGAGNILQNHSKVVRTGDASERFLTTTFIPLSNLAGGLIGAVSVRVSYPDSPGSSEFDFRLERVIREARRKSNALHETSNRIILDAGESVFRQIAAELRAQAEGGQR
jgi:hypothetical protein